MKSIRPTKCKTRIGVIHWLKKLNIGLLTQALYDSDEIVAIHIHRYTGAIVSYEMHDGELIPANHFCMQMAFKVA